MFLLSFRCVINRFPLLDEVSLKCAEACHARLLATKALKQQPERTPEKSQLFLRSRPPSPFRAFFSSSFLLFAELTVEQSVENANICPRQAANTLTITEESLDHFIVLVHNNDRTATFVGKLWQVEPQSAATLSLTRVTETRFRPRTLFKTKEKKQENKQTLVACHDSADINQKTSA